MNIPALKDTQRLNGWTERRLFDTALLRDVRQAIEHNLSQDAIDFLLNRAAKPMFANNKLWKLINTFTGLDFKIPYLFGHWTRNAVTDNLIVTKGKEIAMKQLGGTTTTPVTAIAIGTGTTSPAAGDTALQTEITTGGGVRGAATVTNTTTTTTGDTEQWVKTFNLTSTFAVTEEGLFDNNTSGGNMLARNTFSAINVVNGDSLQITHKVQAT